MSAAGTENLLNVCFFSPKHENHVQANNEWFHFEKETQLLVQLFRVSQQMEWTRDLKRKHWEADFNTFTSVSGMSRNGETYKAKMFANIMKSVCFVFIFRWTVAATRVLLCTHTSFFCIHLHLSIERALNSLHAIIAKFSLKEREKYKWSELESWMKKMRHSQRESSRAINGDTTHLTYAMYAMRLHSKCISALFYLSLAFIVIFLHRDKFQILFGMARTYSEKTKAERITTKQEGRNQAQMVYPWHSVLWRDTI